MMLSCHERSGRVGEEAGETRRNDILRHRDQQLRTISPHDQLAVEEQL